MEDIFGKLVEEIIIDLFIAALIFVTFAICVAISVYYYLVSKDKKKHRK